MMFNQEDEERLENIEGTDDAYCYLDTKSDIHICKQILENENNDNYGNGCISVYRDWWSDDLFFWIGRGIDAELIIIYCPWCGLKL